MSVSIVKLAEELKAAHGDTFAATRIHVRASPNDQENPNRRENARTPGDSRERELIFQLCDGHNCGPPFNRAGSICKSKFWTNCGLWYARRKWKGAEERIRNYIARLSYPCERSWRASNPTAPGETHRKFVRAAARAPLIGRGLRRFDTTMMMMLMTSLNDGTDNTPRRRSRL